MKVLDLFCGAGGCAAGYYRSGLVTSITGVDIKPQPRYPYKFIQADALEYLKLFGDHFDFIHASPPCQRYSVSTKNKDQHPDLLAPVREALKATGKPYIIENVPGAPMDDPITLCGTTFGLKVYRHRRFESNLPLVAPEHKPHRDQCLGNGKGMSPKGFVTVVGHNAGIYNSKGVTWEYVQNAMGIDWMSRAELSQAIPPAYTEYLGRQVLELLRISAVG
jgi:DNA (cytosine-5)-methyltransferase 1